MIHFHFINNAALSFFCGVGLLINNTCSLAKNQSLSKPLEDYRVRESDISFYLTQVKGYSPTKASSLDVEPVVYESDTVFYIINYEKGWEVLSGDKRAPVVLINCDAGSITIDDLYSSPTQSAYIDALTINLSKALNDADFYSSEEIQDSWLCLMESLNGAESGGGKRPVNKKRSIIYSETRDHLLSTKWGQGAPWNQEGPYKNSSMSDHCLMGCVPVAAAQVLYYLHYKIGKPVGTYGFSTCNAYIPFGSDYLVLSSSDVIFNYNAPLHWVDFPLTAGGTGQYHKVSTLMLRIGYLYGAKYYTNKTLSYTGKAVTVFPSEFSISCVQTDPITLSQLINISHSQIYEEELPILMSITDATYERHSIVLDGYKFVVESISSNIITSRFLAINWGWDGLGDSDASGNTIWYNMTTAWIVSSYTYNAFNYIVSNFSAIN